MFGEHNKLSQLTSFQMSTSTCMFTFQAVDEQQRHRRMKTSAIQIWQIKAMLFVCVCVCMQVGGLVGVSFYLCALRPNNLQNSWLRHKTAQRVCVCVCEPHNLNYAKTK